MLGERFGRRELHQASSLEGFGELSFGSEFPGVYDDLSSVAVTNTAKNRLNPS